MENIKNDLIEKENYKNSLLLYTILKLLIKCNLSETKMNLMQSLVTSENIDESISNDEFKKLFLLSEDIVRKKSVNRFDYETLINLINADNIAIWRDLCSLALDLLSVKKLILEESKTFAKVVADVNVKKIKDKLSVEYDLSRLQIPYGTRVAASLLSYATTYPERYGNFILKNSNQIINNLNHKIILINKKYKINISDIYSLIISESVNQSIVSDAGNSFETRFHEMILKYVDSIDGNSHDENFKSVEYDFILTLNKVKIGVSVKRTLRERYKQNLDDIDKINVDFLLLVTLGIDLNEDKLKSILQKKNVFVLVSKEMYNIKDFLNKSKNVISSEQLSRDKLEAIFKIK